MKKAAIIAGYTESQIGMRAIEELSSLLLDYTHEYPVCVTDDTMLDGDYRRIYVGTAKNNSYIKENSRGNLSVTESYAISVKNDTVIIEGFDDAGALYGVLDFYGKYLALEEKSMCSETLCNPWESETLPDFEYVSAPACRERGLWTWGHVIYDYRGYFDNMMRLKMNAVIIWNDFVPFNAKSIVEYAHARNIKVYWGFAWLWDTSFNKLSIKKLDGEPEKILAKYENEYAAVGGDGIYFQTFTELKSDNIDGVLIAETAADFVNKTAALLYEKYPSIDLQFGLHATSVKDRLSFIASVDERIKIVWEDCGAFPFSYSSTDIEGYEQTCEFVRTVANLRGKSERFGVVTKGLTKLDWNEFKHITGSQCIGVCSDFKKRSSMERKRPVWRYAQSGWMANADKAHDMIRLMRREGADNLSVFALVEDGMFEEFIMYPVALYAEMLWDITTDTKQIMKEVALRRYVCYP